MDSQTSSTNAVPRFTAFDCFGKTYECVPLFLFDGEYNGKTHHYLVFTDNTTDEEGYTRVYASHVDDLHLTPEDLENGFAHILLDSLDDEEWPIVEHVLKHVQAMEPED